MKTLISTIFMIAVSAYGQAPVKGHTVWGKDGGYLCQPWGARCRVPSDKQIAAHESHKPVKCRKGYHLMDNYPDGIHNKPECRPDWDSGEIGTGKNDIGYWTCAKCTDLVGDCVRDGLACSGPVEMLPKPETKPADITALMERIAPTEPHPTVEVEPITRSVLHCPEGWRVEVWHKEYCPTCATFSVVPAQLVIQQGHPAEYHPYSPPTPLMAEDNDTDRDHPPQCVKEKAK
jgi:hypothetical protein